MTEERDVASRPEVFEWVASLCGAILTNQPPPPRPSARSMRREDLQDASDAFTRTLAQHFDKIPAEVSEDLAIQETIRAEFDRVFTETSARMRKMLDSLTGQG